MKNHYLKNSLNQTMSLYALNELLNQDSYKSYFVDPSSFVVFSTKQTSHAKPLKLTSQCGTAGYMLSYLGRPTFVSLSMIRFAIGKLSSDKVDTKNDTSEKWRVLRPDVNTLFSEVYSTQEEANAAAEKYARSNPGREYAVCKVFGTVAANAISWT